MKTDQEARMTIKHLCSKGVSNVKWRVYRVFPKGWSVIIAAVSKSVI